MQWNCSGSVLREGEDVDVEVTGVDSGLVSDQRLDDSSGEAAAEAFSNTGLLKQLVRALRADWVTS